MALIKCKEDFMKKIVFIIIGMFLSFSCYSEQQDSAFGVQQGMTKDDLSKLVKLEPFPNTTNVNYYLSYKAPIMNNNFSYYGYYFSNTGKICNMTGYIQINNDNTYGIETKEQFEKIKKILIGKYGTPKSFDYLRKGSVWKDDRYWMTALAKDERRLAAHWTKKDNSDKLTGNIRSIMLDTLATDEHNSYLKLDYEFEDMDLCHSDEKKADAQGL